MSRPNILFLMSDQHRWDAMGCSGDWVQTPNMLFDRRADPMETENRSGRSEVREIEEHLRLQILDRMVQTQIYQPRLDAQQQRWLRRTGVGRTEMEDGK